MRAGGFEKGLFELLQIIASQAKFPDLKIEQAKQIHYSRGRCYGNESERLPIQDSSDKLLSDSEVFDKRGIGRQRCTHLFDFRRTGALSERRAAGNLA